MSPNNKQKKSPTSASISVEFRPDLADKEKLQALAGEVAKKFKMAGQFGTSQGVE